MVVVRTEHHRSAESRRLNRIVYPFSETAAYVCHMPEPVDRIKQSHGIDNQYIGVDQCGLRGACVANETTLEQIEDEMQMRLVNLVRHENQLGNLVCTLYSVFCTLHISFQQLLVLRPRTAGYHHALATLHESLNQPQFLRELCIVHCAL